MHSGLAWATVSRSRCSVEVYRTSYGRPVAYEILPFRSMPPYTFLRERTVVGITAVTSHEGGRWGGF